jgi:hypothetical protein
MSIRVERKRNARNSEAADRREQRALKVQREEAERIAKNSARLKALRIEKESDN